MPPNILWILTTQWRAQAAGYAGDVNARTPFLDSLAALSVNFTEAVTPHPFGPFARAAILTGVPSPQNGVRGYFDPLPPRARTIAHEMAERSYTTAFFGKWHLSLRDRQGRLTGEDHAKILVPEECRGGFGFWEGFESGFLVNDPWLHGTRIPQPKRFEGYQSDVVCERARDMLSHLGGPWFAVVSLEAPHPPYGAPAAGVRPADPTTIVLRGNVPAAEPGASRARRELSGYYAHIEATDRSIGRLVDGIAPETIVVVASVHGDMHGSHGLFRKGWPYDESVRVPLLIRGPRAIGREHSPISLIDLPAMARAWADRGGPHAVEETRPKGFARISMPSVVNLPDQCDRVWTGLRTADRKLVLDERGSPWLFFDLQQDPLEMKDLSRDPERRREIEGLSGLLRC